MCILHNTHTHCNYCTGGPLRQYRAGSLVYLLSGAMSLHHLPIMTKPSLSCLLCFLCMSAIPIFPFLKCEEFLIYLYKYKNEVGCRDDTMPKTVNTRRHSEEESESMQQTSATPKNQDVGIGLRKIVAYSHSCLLVSTVFGTVSSLHPSSF